MKSLPFTLVLSFITSLLVWSPVNAYTIEGVTLNETIPATEERPELVLNGAALREMYFLVKTYVGALYLEEPNEDAQAIIASETHKRMIYTTLLKKVSARRIANALQEALVVNLTADEHKNLNKELAQMLSYFDGKVYEGEETIFDYIPGKGTRITMNGVVKGIIPGEDYFKAMLSMWIGKTPVGRNFKESVLGLNRPKKPSQVANK
ncbi:MAG: chalcone isomerase family protein [Bermanella sp.]